ncbi:MAG: hypothetical protein QW840_03230 [Candidatus Bathyarchaeia archaeon]
MLIDKFQWLFAEKVCFLSFLETARSPHVTWGVGQDELAETEQNEE